MAEEEPVSKFSNNGTPLYLFRLFLFEVLTSLAIASVGFLNQKMSQMTSLAFHPHHMTLSSASSDGHISNFTMEGTSRRDLNVSV